jgi:galactose mutarotase-like enzyme
VGNLSSWERLELASDELRAVLLPGRGGDIASLEHLPSGAQLLWTASWSTPAGPAVPDGADFHDWYFGGWQDLFPNGGTPAEVDGIGHEQHGEAWRRPWAVTPLDGGVRLDVTLSVLPLRARKTIRVSGSTLSVQERIENAGSEALRMMWGHHPAYGGALVEAGARVDLPGGRTECFGSAVDSTSRLADKGTGRWPLLPGRDGGEIDLSVVPGPENETHDVALITDLEAGWYAIRNPSRRLGVAVRFPRDVFGFVWMWQPYGGATYAPFDQGIYALALEPWTSPPRLDAAVARGADVRLAPGEGLEAEIELTVFAADKRPVLDVGQGGVLQR